MTHEHRGDCLYCGTSNSYSSFNCYSCQTKLPWAEALTQMLAQSQPPASNPLASPQAQHQLAPIAPMHGQMQPSAPQAAPLATPKYCAHCGSGHASSARFCSGCGTAILSAQPAQQPDAPGNSPRFAFNWPLQSATTPATTPAMVTPTAMATAQSGYPTQGGFMFSPQQSVNVHVVTEQKTERKRGKRGFLSGLLALFSTGCAGLALLALANGNSSGLAMGVGLALLAVMFAMLAKI